MAVFFVRGRGFTGTVGRPGQPDQADQFCSDTGQHGDSSGSQTTACSSHSSHPDAPVSCGVGRGLAQPDSARHPRPGRHPGLGCRHGRQDYRCVTLHSGSGIAVGSEQGEATNRCTLKLKVAASGTPEMCKSPTSQNETSGSAYGLLLRCRILMISRSSSELETVPAVPPSSVCQKPSSAWHPAPLSTGWPVHPEAPA